MCKWRSAVRGNTPPTILARASAADRTHLPQRSSKSRELPKKSRTTLLKLIRPPHLSLSLTRCPAVEWTTYSLPIHRLRIGSPHSMNYRAKWDSVISARRRRLGTRDCMVPGDSHGCLLLGVKQTSRLRCGMSASDPKRTSWIHHIGRFCGGVGGPIQPGNQPVADRGAEPFDRGFVEDQPYGGFRQLFAIAQEHAALTQEPYRTNRNRALVGVRQEAADEIGGKSQEWCRLFSDQAAKYRSRLHAFPIQDTHMAGVFVAPQQGLQLSANKLRHRFLPRHPFEFFGIGELVFGQAAKGLAQHFAIEAVLALEMVVDRRLVDFGLGDNGADAGAIVAALGEQPLRGPHDLLARELGGSRHPRCYPHFQTRVNYSLRRTPPFSRSRFAIRPCLQSSDARLVKASSFRARLGAPSPSADRPDPIGS